MDTTGAFGRLVGGVGQMKAPASNGKRGIGHAAADEPRIGPVAGLVVDKEDPFELAWRLGAAAEDAGLEQRPARERDPHLAVVESEGDLAVSAFLRRVRDTGFGPR